MNHGKFSFYDAQKEAIVFKDGPCLVLAGPGSGKTAVLVERICHLIGRHHIAPGHILVITFTRAAALQMRERFVQRISETDVCGSTGAAIGAAAGKTVGNTAGNTVAKTAAREVTFGTFHSVFWGFLRESCGLTPQSLIKEKEKVQILKEVFLVLKKRGLQTEDVILGEENAEDLIREISRMKNSGQKPEDKDPVFCEIYALYQTALREQKRLDMDDILLETERMLTQRPEVLSRLHKQYTYILVDEFQDINPVQYRILKLLSAPSHHLFVVGDDDQAIYGFRGCDPGVMMTFLEEFPQAKQILLYQNFRCDKEIVDASCRMIRQNEVRLCKDILSATGDEGRMVPVFFKDTAAQYTWMCEEILKAYSRGIPFAEQAVLFRSHTEMQGMVRLLRQKGIPYRKREGIVHPYEQCAAQDLAAYLMAAEQLVQSGTCARGLLFKIMNKPSRDFLRGHLEEETVDFHRWMDGVTTKEEKKRISDFYGQLLRMGTMSPFAAVLFFRKVVGYESYVMMEYGQKREDIVLWMGALDHLTKLSKEVMTQTELLDRLNNREEDREVDRGGAEDVLPLMTLHAAKGLEFDRVMIANVVEGRIPFQRAGKVGNLEEERRLLYVGMTRARHALYLCAPAILRQKKTLPSRFLSEVVREDCWEDMQNAWDRVADRVSNQSSEESSSSAKASSSRYSSNRSDTISNSSSSSMFSREGLPSASSM